MSALDKVLSWFNLISIPIDVFNDLQDSLRNKHESLVRAWAQFDQAAFLLSQAPLMQAPAAGEAHRLRAIRTPYTYIHPETFQTILGKNFTLTAHSAHLGTSPTLFIFTKLLPLGHMILTSNLIPEFKVVGTRGPHVTL